MATRAFISHAGVDAHVVERLLNAIPKDYYVAYQFDFVDGQKLIGEMKRLVDDCSIFILLASRASIDSVWCRFEIDLAEVQSIKRFIKIFVFPIESEVRVRDLPGWMQDYWMSSNASRLSLLQRRLIALLEDNIVTPMLSGVATRVDEVKRSNLAHLTIHKISPNVFYFSGLEGIGRYTTAREFLKSLYGNERFALGPIIKLADPASIESLYIRLREDYSGSLGKDLASEVQAFRSLDMASRIRETASVIALICADDETIYIRCSSGFFGENGQLIDWAAELFRICAGQTRSRIVVITNRQPRQRDLESNLHLGHSAISDLSSGNVTALVQKYTMLIGGEALQPSSQALVAIGGHPILALNYAASLARYGTSSEERAWYEAIFRQSNMMSEFLGFEALHDEDKKILCLLSWFPRLHANTLQHVCARLGVDQYDMVIEDLLTMCLIIRQQGYFAISGPIRLTFRQLYGVGGAEIIEQVEEVLEDLLADPENFRADVIETLSFLMNVNNRKLPSPLDKIVSSASMLDTARTLYRIGRERSSRDEFEKCVTLCDAAVRATDEVALIQDLRMIQARSLLRMNMFPEADETIRLLEKSATRESRAIRASYYRFKREPKKAIPIFEEVIRSGVNHDAVIHELCLCLRETGAFERVGELIRDYDRRVQRNMFLLDVKASLEIGGGRFADAEKTIERMSKLVDHTQATARKRAVLIAAESGNYREAVDLLTEATQKISAGNRAALGDLLATRCMLYAKLGLLREAQQDLAHVRITHRQADRVSDRLKIHIALADGEAQEALQLLNGLSDKSRIDRALERRVYLALSEDTKLPLLQREEYKQQWQSSLADRNPLTEFDF